MSFCSFKDDERGFRPGEQLVRCLPSDSVTTVESHASSSAAWM